MTDTTETRYQPVGRGQALSNNLRPYGAPGKFEGELLISTVINDEFDADVSFGNDGYVDFYGLVSGPVEATATPEGEALNQDEIHYLKTFAGAIVHQDNQGFVSVTWFDPGTAQSLAESWGRLEAEAAAADALDDDEADAP